jgi:hypothetical protein
MTVSTKTQRRRRETIDGSTGEVQPSPRRRRVKLRTVEDFNREHVRVYREYRAGVISAQDFGRVIYGLRLMQEGVAVAELGPRIAELAQRLGVTLQGQLGLVE